MTKSSALAALALLLCACEPWCLRDAERGFRPSAEQALRLQDIDKAAAAYRDALLTESEGDDEARIVELFAAVQGYRTADTWSEPAEAYLVEHLAGFIRDSAASFPTSELREAAVRRALRGYRTHVLPRSTDAGKYLK